eukprot:TRINITY_DN7055_c0_g2_i1.p1 TRINITY_DN7055_c0_g2~~TRINITY_DN7055_c0_g2_i1.p1  ORF type:complete len:484 (+),score=123.18 TRINITY_DN7055_c0_g2_i1:31-1452(+)
MEVKLSPSSVTGLCGLVEARNDPLPDLKSPYSYSISNNGRIYVKGKENFFIPDFNKQNKSEINIGILYCPKAKVIIFTKDGKSLGVTIRRVEGIFVPVLQNQTSYTYNFKDNFEFPLASFCQGLNYPPPPNLNGRNLTDEQAHSKYWFYEIKQQLNTRYPKSISDNEKKDEYYLRNSIDMPLLLQRIQELCGITLNQRIITDTRQGRFVQLDYLDVLSMEPKLSYFPLIDFAEGVTTLLQIIEQPKSALRDALVEKRQLLEAEQKISCSTSESSMPLILFYKGSVYYQIAIRSTNDEKKEYLDLALKQFQKLNINDEEKEIYQYKDLSQSLDMNQYTKDLQDIYLNSLYMEGLIQLHKHDNLYDLFPNHSKLLDAAKIIKKAYLIPGGRELLYQKMARLTNEVEGCTYEEAFNILLEAQTIKIATGSSGLASFISSLIFIIHICDIDFNRRPGRYCDLARGHCSFVCRDEGKL